MRRQRNRERKRERKRGRSGEKVLLLNKCRAQNVLSEKLHLEIHFFDHNAVIVKGLIGQSFYKVLISERIFKPHTGL